MVNNKTIYILFLLSLFFFKGSAYDKDTLNIDKNSSVLVHELPTDFKEKYQGDEFVYEYEFSNSDTSFWERFKAWLSHLFDKIFDFDSPVSARSFTEYFIKTVYFIAFIAILYLIAKTLLKKEGNWVFGRRKDNLDITTESLEVDLLVTDFDSLIEKAIKTTDYRLATRYYYLKTLKKLTNKAIIDWDPEKTNYDYYQEIKEEEIQKQFQYISYLYNYSWYGEFELDTTAYSEVKAAFHSLFKTIG